MAEDDPTGGLTQTNDGTLFGNPDGGGNEHDYDNWSWKQIAAAINGATTVDPGSDHSNEMAQISDPASFGTTARAFYFVQRTLEMISISLQQQSTALAGDDRGWQGASAEAFLAMTKQFSRQVKANAAVLSRGAGMASVPKQLTDNGNNLARARVNIHNIDVWYAAEAARLGAGRTSNGLIVVSSKPEVVALMTRDMRTVIRNLAANYKMTIENVIAPTAETPVPEPLPDGGGGTGDDGGGGGGGGLPDTGGSGLPDTGGAGTDGLGSDGLGTGGLGTDDLAGGSADPFGGGLGTGSGLDPSDLDSVLNPGTGGVTDFPGLGDGSLGTGGLGDLGTGGLGDLGTSGLGGIGGLGSFPGSLGTSSLGSGSGLKGWDSSTAGLSDPSMWTDPAADYSGLTGTDDSGLGLPADYTGSEAAGLGDVLGGGSTESSGSGMGGMPMMPMMPGSGAGGGAKGGAERPDAAGLLSSDAAPWQDAEGTGLPVDGVDIGSGTPAGAPSGDTTSTAGIGGVPAMPMPMFPGAAGAGSGSGSGAPERPDAAGLVSGEAADWEAGAAPVGTDEQIGSPDGAPPGVATTGMPVVVPGRAPGAGASAPHRAQNAGASAEPTAGAVTPAGATASAGAGASAGATASPGATAAAASTPLPAPAPAPAPAVAGAPAMATASAGGTHAAGATEPAGATAVAGATQEHEVRSRTDGAAHGSADSERIALVPQADDTEDTSMWEVATASFLPLLRPFAGGNGTDDRDRDGLSSAEERAWTPPEPGAPPPGQNFGPLGEDPDPEYTTWQPATARQTPPPGPPPTPAGGEPLHCGGDDTPPPEPEPEPEPEMAGEPDDAEQAERTSADLLVEDGDLWGARRDDMSSLG
ncbi:hypothetical protein [Streptomyces sp. SID12488]|uniref:hypothetical protein n=1 Tax=Streptomyces sp. SID12488 TaxID=2706040 RepID=UPI0013DC7284|nr:hypothetical protein [Streptomyces sp. SID12488]NEA68936.1 hypothetical protein [Streptomyces sp. SID12488]